MQFLSHWVRRKLADLDRLNGKVDDQERDVGIGLIIGALITGFLLGIIGMAPVIRVACS